MAAATVAQRINPGDGHTYTILGVPEMFGFSGLTWTSAQAAAMAINANLATITTQAQDDWIVRFGQPYAGNIWIGINDKAVSGTFVWASGQPVVYTNWEPGEPNNIGIEHYGELFTFDLGKWNNGDGLDTGAMGIAESNNSVARFDWNKPAGGTFATSANWTPTGIPGTNDGAYFALNSTYSVTFAGVTNNALNVIEAGNVTHNLGSFVRTATETYVAPQAGQTASLTLTNGTLNNSYVTIGDAPGSNGTLAVGAGTTATASQTMFVGNYGTGALAVTGGGKVLASTLIVGAAVSSSGTLSVDGAGSSIGAANITFASQGTANVSVTNGATIHSDGMIFVSDQHLGLANLTVSGVGSSITSAGEFDIALSGSAMFTLTNSATATVGNIYDGAFSGGNGAIVVSNGATLTGTQDFNIGASGSGTLQVTGGAHVSIAGTYYIGANGMLGFASVSGPGSTLSATFDLGLGNNGFGSLTAANGASVNVNNIYVGGYGLGVGTLSFFDSTTHLTAQGTVSVANDTGTLGTFNVNAGTVSIGSDLSVGVGGMGIVNITGGGHVTAPFVGIGRFYTGTIGTINVSGAGSTLTDTGDMSIGETSGSTGSLSVMAGGSVTTHYINIGSGGTGSVGVLSVGAGGTVNTGVSDINLYSPTASIQLAGGTINTSNVNLSDPGSTISGFGTINGAIHSSGKINATGGTLTIGDATRTDGIAYGGLTINVSPNAVLNLLDADQADIYGPVTLNNGVLIARHGAYLGGNSPTGYGVIVGNTDASFSAITGTVNLSASFDVGAQTAHVYSRGPAGFGALTTLSGGSILSPSGVALSGGNTISGFGSIAANVSLVSGVLSATGGALTVFGALSGYGVTIGTVNAGSNQIASPTGTVDLPAGLTIGNRTANVYSLGSAHLGGTTTLTTGGNLIATTGITLNGGDQIFGAGSVTANVNLAGGSLRGSGGTLAVAGTVSGFGITNSSVSATTFAPPIGNLTINSPIIIGGESATFRSQNPTSVLSSVSLSSGSVNSTSGIDLKPGGSITGGGVIAGQLIADGGTVNAGPGAITFSGNVVAQGQTLNTTGAVINAGTLNLLGTNAVLAGTQFINTGTIAGHGTIFTSSSLTNSGSMQFSGATDILGPVTNSNSILVTGGGAGGPSTFYNAVANTGNINVSQGASAVFLGFVSGAGAFSGSGTKVFDGGGGSPASLTSIVGSTVIKPGTALSTGVFNESAVTIQGSLQLNSNGAIANRTGSLTISPGAKLDLADNDLIVDYTVASPATIIRSYLAGGFNVGNWNGAGIASLAAHNDGTSRTGLGYAEASDLGVTLFDGQTVTTKDVLVKYTYYGDANLDGVVTTTDFKRFIDGLAGGGSTWSQGDFTYDGKVDLGNDFNLFLTGFITQGGALGDLQQVIASSDELTAGQRAQLLSAVPEPVAVLPAAGIMMLSRRRRRF